jgi:hypothetical protein
MVFGTFCFPKLLRDWAADRSTGTFKVFAAPPTEEMTTVLVERGQVVYAMSRSRRDPTGELFLELFEAPEEDADETDEARERVLEALAGLFALDTAEVRFSDGITLSRWPRIDVPLADLLLLNLRRVADAERLTRWLGATNRPYRTEGDLFAAFTCQPTPEEAFVLTRFDGTMTIDELLTVGGPNRIVTLRLACALVYSGVLVPVREHERAPIREAAEPPSDVFEAARYWYTVEQKLRDIRAGADHYEVLEIDRDAPAGEIDDAYRRMRRELIRPDLRDLAPASDAVRQLAEIEAALAAALATLASPSRRGVYDAELARFASSDSVVTAGLRARQ